MKTVMCSTCGLEVDARNKDHADKQHKQFDPAHEAHWYEDGRSVW
jgi:hypothetical protein